MNKCFQPMLVNNLFVGTKPRSLRTTTTPSYFVSWPAMVMVVQEPIPGASIMFIIWCSHQHGRFGSCLDKHADWKCASLHFLSLKERKTMRTVIIYVSEAYNREKRALGPADSRSPPALEFHDYSL